MQSGIFSFKLIALPGLVPNLERDVAGRKAGLAHWISIIVENLDLYPHDRGKSFTVRYILKNNEN